MKKYILLNGKITGYFLVHNPPLYAQTVYCSQPGSPTFLLVPTQFTLFDSSSVQGAGAVCDINLQGVPSIWLSCTAPAYPSFSPFSTDMLSLSSSNTWSGGFYQASNIDCWAFLQFCNFAILQLQLERLRGRCSFSPHGCQAAPRMDHTVSVFFTFCSPLTNSGRFETISCQNFSKCLSLPLFFCTALALAIADWECEQHCPCHWELWLWATKGRFLIPRAPPSLIFVFNATLIKGPLKAVNEPDRPLFIIITPLRAPSDTVFALH